MANTTRERTTRTARIGGLYRTDTGKKYAMAISGVVLLAFVLGHMIGNLHAFEGAHGGVYRIDEYAEGLRDLGEPLLPRTMVLWVFFRLPLTAAFLVHIHAAWALTRSNKAGSGAPNTSPPATTWPPATPAARCGGAASSSSCSCCGIWRT